MASETVILAKENGIATITLNRPEKLNALNWELLAALEKAVEDVSSDSDVRVVILTGAGKAFCAGADLTPGVFANTDSAAKVLERGIRGIKEVAAFRNMPKAVIASVNGVAAGGGMSLALCCDIIIASETARFSMAFVRAGITPDHGASYILPQLIGPAKACELIFTGRIIDAKEAERIGLVNRVVAPEMLAAETLELASTIAKGPPIAIALAKVCIYNGLSSDMTSALRFEASALAISRSTEDAAESRHAWAEKREPHFKGR